MGAGARSGISAGAGVLGRPVAGTADIVAVVAESTHQGGGAAPKGDVKDVVAVAPGQGVVAGAAVERVVAGATGERIVELVAVERERKSGVEAEGVDAGRLRLLRARWIE